MALWRLHDAQLGPLGSREQLGSVWILELVAHVAYALRGWLDLRNHDSGFDSVVSSLTRSS